MRTILVADDDRAIRRTLELHLAETGYTVLTAATGNEAVDLALARDVGLVLLDLRLTGMDGFEVLTLIKERKPALPVIMITAYDDMQTAIEAIRLGAIDHLGKPLDLDQLDQIIDKIFEMSALSRTGVAFRDSIDAPFEQNIMVGRSRAMKEVYKTIGAIADFRATVLIQGESGTGKEMVARAIHFNSKFRNRPFIAVACSALSPTVLESELFGHEKGAFTGAYRTKPGKFELAQGGTLFLDEISEISPELQVKLLRFIQEREFERVGGIETIKADVRIVAATNKNLLTLVNSGIFRHDLYYRLKVVSIDLPPLRERRDDIPILVKFLLEKLHHETGKRVDIIPQETMNAILAHPWAGNVRELENTLRRAVLLSHGSVLSPESLHLEEESESDSFPLVLRPLHEVEREHIQNVLAFTHNEKKRAAEILGISRPTLDRRIKEYGLEDS
ncbi:two component, sigma54 specific, transcriptional regulator, Fis family [Geobacter metallireducens RCH3]|uniref:DNA-binding transcriptional regulator NtrC n=1 Tax=Geobacter metallireducens (strain ATCC 53774 / DSM 7210 / GS-15) TaxID=269799 RepID=Q39TQ0_GEOMG|nr:sigma-54 dependent transcriptional regulator [Geobacter metallireducens]ABB32374.1 sigma-54-dependent transcriptional response regulator [Geobacter metallireducens GS-15]EHP86736.1 two component, sigma54 specific, transcriptional regulator, Fis family [Geobacter metallireducens RCH3]